MKRYKLAVLCAFLLVAGVLASCNSNTHANSGQPSGSDAVSESVLSIVNDCLDRAYEATRIRNSDFPVKVEEEIDGFCPFDYDFVPDEPNEDWTYSLDIMQQLHSVSDVEQFFRNAFDNRTADTLLERLLGGVDVIYKDIDGQIYQNHGISPGPSMCYTWLTDEIEVLYKSAVRIVVQMPALRGYMVDDANLQVLVLVFEEEQWLLTDSFFEANYLTTLPQ